MSQDNARTLGIGLALIGLIASVALACYGHAVLVLITMAALWLMSSIGFQSRLRKAAEKLSVLRSDYEDLMAEHEDLTRENDRLRQEMGKGARTQGHSRRQSRGTTFEDLFKAAFAGFAAGARPRSGGFAAGIFDELLREMGIDPNNPFAGGFAGAGFPGANPGTKPARDYYEVLGAERTDSADDLKHKYRKRAMECHPDRNPGDKAKEAEFKELNEAYECLKDENKRAFYDRWGVPPT